MTTPPARTTPHRAKLHAGTELADGSRKRGQAPSRQEEPGRRGPPQSADCDDEAVHLRRYRDDDREAVWQLHNLALEHAGAHGGSGPWDDDLNAIRETYLDGGGEFLVGVDGGQIVAMGALRRCDADCAELKRMRIHPAVQRRGLGRRLLHRLEERALELGYRTLVLDTTMRQEAAQALYRGEGYRETGRRRAGRFELVFFEKQIR